MAAFVSSISSLVLAGLDRDAGTLMTSPRKIVALGYVTNRIPPLLILDFLLDRLGVY